MEGNNKLDKENIKKNTITDNDKALYCKLIEFLKNNQNQLVNFVGAKINIKVNNETYNYFQIENMCQYCKFTKEQETIKGLKITLMNIEDQNEVIILLLSNNGERVFLKNKNEELLGRGSFGKVVKRLQYHPDKKRKDRDDTKEVAFKLETEKNAHFDLKYEFDQYTKIIKQLGNNQGIINIKGFSLEQEEQKTSQILVIELCKQSLQYYIDNKSTYKEEEILSIVYQSLETAIRFTKNQISHRDIKPDNILSTIKNQSLESRICDFGLAIGALKHETIAGSMMYLAPELLETWKKNQEGKEKSTYNYNGADEYSMIKTFFTTIFKIDFKFNRKGKDIESRYLKVTSSFDFIDTKTAKDFLVSLDNIKPENRILLIQYIQSKQLDDKKQGYKINLKERFNDYFNVIKDILNKQNKENPHYQLDNNNEIKYKQKEEQEQKNQQQKKEEQNNEIIDAKKENSWSMIKDNNAFINSSAFMVCDKEAINQKEINDKKQSKEEYDGSFIMLQQENKEYKEEGKSNLVKQAFTKFLGLLFYQK